MDADTIVERDDGQLSMKYLALKYPHVIISKIKKHLLRPKSTEVRLRLRRLLPQVSENEQFRKASRICYQSVTDGFNASFYSMGVFTSHYEGCYQGAMSHFPGF